MEVNLTDLDHPSIRLTGTLISLNDSDKLDVAQVYHCYAPLKTTVYTRLVFGTLIKGKLGGSAWNPNPLTIVSFGMLMLSDSKRGKSCRAHKVLRFAHPPSKRSVDEIYDVSSDSWRVLDVAPDWKMDVDGESNSNNYGVSLEGNVYWFAQDKDERGNSPVFLLCYDFTTERFVPRLPLSFES